MVHHSPHLCQYQLIGSKQCVSPVVAVISEWERCEPLIASNKTTVVIGGILPIARGHCVADSVCCGRWQYDSLGRARGSNYAPAALEYVLHCPALHCTALHCTSLHYCTALHCTAQPCHLHFTLRTQRRRDTTSGVGGVESPGKLGSLAGRIGGWGLDLPKMLN